MMKRNNTMIDKVIALKFRTVVTVTSTAGGLVNFAWNYGDISGSPEWTSAFALYDSYRVTGFKLQFFPRYPNDNSTISYYQPIYSLIDYDSNGGGASSVATAIQYGTMKAHNMQRPWKRYFKIGKQAVAGTQLGWADTNNTAAFKGSAQIYGDGFPISGSLGNCILTYYAKFKNRR